MLEWKKEYPENKFVFRPYVKEANGVSNHDVPYI